MTLSHAFVFLFSSSMEGLGLSFNIAIHGSFILSMLLFLMAWCKDPGYLKKDEDIDFFDNIERFDSNHLCPECEVIRTERSRHCNICNKCVERFDHHCPWINNCIGIRNHGAFYLYIIVTIVYILLVVLICSYILYQSIFNAYYFQDSGN